MTCGDSTASGSGSSARRTGQSALTPLEELTRAAAPLALIVADQRMPGMSGIDVLKAARPLHPDVGMVLLTAYADTDAAIAAINDVRLDSIVNFAVLYWTRAFRPFQIGRLSLILAIPFALQLIMGGFAVLFCSVREALAWFAAFVGTVLICGVAQPLLVVTNPLPEGVVRAFFVMNLSAVSPGTDTSPRPEV